MPNLNRRQLFASLITIPAVGAVLKQTKTNPDDRYALRYGIDSGGFRNRFYGTAASNQERLVELKTRPLFALPNDAPIKATVYWTIEEPSGRLYFENCQYV